MPQPKSNRSQSGKPKRTGNRAKSSASRASSGSSGQRARRSAPKAQRSPEVDSGNVGALVELLQRSIEGPLAMVMLTNERIQEVMDDAVERGRMTRGDAEELVDSLVKRGRRTSEDFIADVEELLGKSREGIGSAAVAARRSKPADRMLREVDRARRATGVGPAFPILAYDELTAAQVAERLADLSAPELRKVRDYERRHGNRKSVLQSIESKLG